MSYVSDYTARTKEIFIGNFRRFTPLNNEFFSFYKVYKTKQDYDLAFYTHYARKYLYSIRHIVPNPLISEFIEETERSLTEVIKYHSVREIRSIGLIADMRKRLFQIYMSIEMILEKGLVIVTHVRTEFWDKDSDCLESLLIELKGTIYGIHEKTGIKEIIHSNVVYAVIFK